MPLQQKEKETADCGLFKALLQLIISIGEALKWLPPTQDNDFDVVLIHRS